ncbi:MAG: FAD binding domain-containing protein [Candidatus Eisenbacteria bacterium]|nr:FAD binding domain-containing protein [Candidatus Eisenbacteria bacterium]
MAIRSFHRAATPEEAVRLLRAGGARTFYVAGGTDLLSWHEPLDAVVSVREALRYLRREEAEFVVGASATVSMVEAWEELARADGGLLRSCARDFATWQIRNLATIGGNLASAVPSADFAPPLLVLDARCVVQGTEDRREVPLSEFFAGAHESVLGADLLVEIRFEEPAPRSGLAWEKIGRTDGDIAIVNAAARIDRDGKKCREARLALGAVAPTPFRAREAEEFLRGKEPDAKTIARAAELAAAAARPIDDQRASAAYRKAMGELLARRVLAAAAEGRGGR